MRSHTSTSTYSSVSAGSESSEPAMRRLMRHSSLETINTNITSADEFVWVDSHNRFVSKVTFFLMNTLKVDFQSIQKVICTFNYKKS